jgi:hypothetical protein
MRWIRTAFNEALTGTTLPAEWLIITGFWTITSHRISTDKTSNCEASDLPSSIINVPPSSQRNSLNTAHARAYNQPREYFDAVLRACEKVEIPEQ